MTTAAPYRGTRQIRKDIELNRSRIGAIVAELGNRGHEVMDWRFHVSRYPLVFAGAAAGVGGALVLLLRRSRPTTAERAVEAIVDNLDDWRKRSAEGLDAVVSALRGASRTTNATRGDRLGAGAALAVAIARTAAAVLSRQSLSSAGPSQDDKQSQQVNP